jgi:hypothetical protein
VALWRSNQYIVVDEEDEDGVNGDDWIRNTAYGDNFGDDVEMADGRDVRSMSTEANPLHATGGASGKSAAVKRPSVKHINAVSDADIYKKYQGKLKELGLTLKILKTLREDTTLLFKLLEDNNIGTVGERVLMLKYIKHYK